MKFSSTLLATLVVACLMSGQASALPITYKFGGAVTTVDSPLATAFTVGDAVSISFSAQAPAFLSDPSVSSYRMADFSARVGSRDYTLNTLWPSNALEVSNDRTTGSFNHDAFDIVSAIVDGASAAGLIPFSVSLRLIDSADAPLTSTALTSTALPTSLALGNFGFQFGSVSFCGSRSVSAITAECSRISSLQFSVTSVDVIPAPEPAGVSLVMLGLAGARWSRRRPTQTVSRLNTSCS